MATPNLSWSRSISHLQPAFSHLELAALHLKKKKLKKNKETFLVRQKVFKHLEWLRSNILVQLFLRR